MLPWPVIDTVMFDMDGTLLDLHFDNYFWREYLPCAWAGAQSISVDAARQKLESMYRRVHGTLDWYCLDFWAQQLEMDITLLKHEIRHKIAIRPNVIALLKELKNLDKRVLLITNAHPHSLQLKLQETGIGEHFDNTISAHSLRLAKENHGFWRALREIEPYDPARTLLIDDNLAVLQQAQREGIRHLYSIHQPDSRMDPQLMTEFHCIVDFEHIMPATETGHEKIR